MRTRDQSPFGRGSGSGLVARRPGARLSRRRLLAGLAALPPASLLLAGLIARAGRATGTAEGSSKGAALADPGTSPTQPPAAPVPTVLPDLADVPVGSPGVLAGLWSAQELAARPDEARIVRRRPDPSPPEPAALQKLAAQPSTSAEPPPEGSIRRVQPVNEAKVVALTFDLCQRADDITGYDGAIVDVLRKERVAATFFAGGEWLRSHRERALQLMADPLFQVGNHAWTHGNLRVLTGERAEAQVLWTQAEYAVLREELAKRAAAAGIDEAEMARVPPLPTAFRFPYGTCSADTLAMPRRFGLVAIQWDVISGDAVRGQSAATVERAVVDGVRPGSIVVFHANGRGAGTAEALPKIIAGLRGRGYRFVTIATLLKAGTPFSVAECYELRPHDNGRYDKLFGEGTG
ncbi:MAG: polysaccharide deacetylase family protein [Rhodospirillales bacterium]